MQHGQHGDISGTSFSDAGSGVTIKCSWRRNGSPSVVCPSSNTTMSGNVRPDFTQRSSLRHIREPAICRRRSRQRHGAGILASEETIYYAFHPLAGRTVASSGRRVVFGGDVHLTIRLADGTLTLTPEWMLRPVAAACEIRSAPRLCVTRLRDLRAYLEAVLGSDHGDSPLTDGADHAPESPTTGSVRRAAAPATDPERTPPGDGGEGSVRQKAGDAPARGRLGP
jgi:hypothetical protein